MTKPTSKWVLAVLCVIAPVSAYFQIVQTVNDPHSIRGWIAFAISASVVVAVIQTTWERYAKPTGSGIEKNVAKGVMRSRNWCIWKSALGAFAVISNAWIASRNVAHGRLVPFSTWAVMGFGTLIVVSGVSALRRLNREHGTTGA